MKKILLILLALNLAACQAKQENSLAQQQHFICKSLIDGFLKMNHLGQYQLEQIAPTLHTTSEHRNYIYRESSDTAMRLNMPAQQKIAFQCTQSKQHFTLDLLNLENRSTTALMSLDLPPKDSPLDLKSKSMLASVPNIQ